MNARLHDNAFSPNSVADVFEKEMNFSIYALVVLFFYRDKRLWMVKNYHISAIFEIYFGEGSGAAVIKPSYGRFMLRRGDTLPTLCKTWPEFENADVLSSLRVGRQICMQRIRNGRAQELGKQGGFCGRCFLFSSTEIAV